MSADELTGIFEDWAGGEFEDWAGGEFVRAVPVRPGYGTRLLVDMQLTTTHKFSSDDIYIEE